MTLRLVPPIDGADSFELDPVPPRDLPAFRAELRKQLDADNPEPTPMLHMAETVDLLARALPGARELGIAARPHPSDDAIAMDEDAEFDAGDYAEAHDRLAGARALLDALRSDFSNGLEPDELSVRRVVRAELVERNRAALGAFREANMLPLRRSELTDCERIVLDVAMPTLQECARGWLELGATIDDLVGVALAATNDTHVEAMVCTRGAYRRFVQKHKLLTDKWLVSRVMRRPDFPGAPGAMDSLTVVVWSAETIIVDEGVPGHSYTKRPVFTEVSFRTDN